MKNQNYGIEKGKNLNKVLPNISTECLIEALRDRSGVVSAVREDGVICIVASVKNIK